MVGGALPGPEEARELKAAERKAAESHLRASSEVIGYSIRAADGAVGHVEDLLIDDGNRAIADLVVDTRNWLPESESSATRERDDNAARQEESGLPGLI